MRTRAILQHVSVPAPQVGVVIPCFNHGRFVADAVRSALVQVHADVRVVVVNDGSNDGTTPEACDDCLEFGEHVRVVHQANAGLPAARNAGVRAVCEGFSPEFLVFLDADDWIEPGFLRALHQGLIDRNDPLASHAYCQERLVENATGTWRVPEWDPTLLLVTNLHPVTALVRRDCFEAVGGFDESMKLGYEDWDLWLKFAERGWRGVRVREPLFNWRRHSASTMITDAVSRHDELFAMLMHRHPALYASCATEVIRRSNQLLRRADANWLDENGDAIVIRDLRAWVKDLVRERDEASSTAEHLRTLNLQERARAEAAEADAVLRAEAAANRVRAEYEAKPVVRASRAAFKLIDALPGPLTAPLRLLARLARKTPQL